MDWHRPLFGGLINRQIDHLHGGIIVRKQFAAFDRLADHAIERLNRVGGVNHFADFIGIVKKGYQIRPMLAPRRANRGILSVPFFGKAFQPKPGVMLQMNLDFAPPRTMELCGVSQGLTHRQFHII